MRFSELQKNWNCVELFLLNGRNLPKPILLILQARLENHLDMTESIIKIA